MGDDTFKDVISFLEKHYSRLLEKHGDSPQSVQYRDRKTQEIRMKILTEIGDLSLAKILDFGCGTGHLLTFLRESLHFEGDYVGYDVSEKMIETARAKFSDARFEHRNVLDKPPSEAFDYILINGVFNNLIRDNWGYMTAILNCLFPIANKALAFNALSTYVDYHDPGLFYVSPERVFNFCKEKLSPCVTLRHDYRIKRDAIPFEFSVYVYKTERHPE